MALTKLTEREILLITYTKTKNKTELYEKIFKFMSRTLSLNYQEMNGHPIHLSNVLLLINGWATEDYK